MLCAKSIRTRQTVVLNYNCKNIIIVLEVFCPSVKLEQESEQSQSNKFWGVLQILLRWEFLIMGDFFHALSWKDGLSWDFYL